MALADDIRSLVDYACDNALIGPDDRVWAYNSVLEAVGATGPEPGDAWVLDAAYDVGPVAVRGASAGEGAACAVAAQASDSSAYPLEQVLARIAETAVENGVVEDTASGRDRAAMRVMGVVTPRPSDVVSRFDAALAAGSPEGATSSFYKLCCDVGYVRREAIARNIAWGTPTRWGELEITINRSKPEKDPRDIAAAGRAASTGEKYPSCQLCIENEGYSGRSAAAPGGAHPARQNLRIVPIELDGERWGLQYSPYAYFNEHCIAMSAHHRPMHIDAKALTCLLDFVDALPHYFIGSNADLPIVGGSILSHDHFQGGAHEFPMMKAEVASEFTVPDFPGVTGAVMQWPLSVLRLRGADRTELHDACVHVIDTWRAYTDESVGVVAHDADGTPHNTVTPIVRRVDGAGHIGGSEYEAYLALRCNVTTEENPLGLFHPHAEYHHIKKENIGLIEVMGLAILPPRLVGELAAVRAHLLDAVRDGSDVATLSHALLADPASAPHAAWAEGVYARRSADLTEEDAESVLRQEVGVVFGHVLENAGVFKWDEAGRAAQQRFIDAL